jgi:type I restriction enzyme S subunit
MSINLNSYPEHKSAGSSWLGEVPSHWGVVPAFAAFRERREVNKGLREKQVLSLSYGRIVKKKEEALHGLVPASFETYQIVEPGNIILRLTDLQNDQHSLRVGLANDRGIITSAYVCLSPCAPLLPAFAYYYLHSADVQKVFYSMGSGLRQSMDFVDLKRFPILVPSPAEQRQIAKFLDSHGRIVDHFVRAKRHLIELLNEQRQSTIHRIITRGLNPDVQFKPSGLDWMGDVPAHWEIWQIGHFAKVGNGSTPSRGEKSYWADTGYPWLNSASVNAGFITSANQFVTAIAMQECHLPRVTSGSVLVAITGQGKTRGKAAILQMESTINQHLAYISPRTPNISSDFLCLQLMGAYTKLRAISEDAGSTKGALTCEDLKHFRIALPPLGEQIQLANMVRKEIQELEGAITRINREIDLIREYHTRLIFDIATGKLDIRSAELPEQEDNSHLALFNNEAIDETLDDGDETLDDGEEWEMTEERANAAN